MVKTQFYSVSTGKYKRRTQLLSGSEHNYKKGEPDFIKRDEHTGQAPTIRLHKNPFGDDIDR